MKPGSKAAAAYGNQEVVQRRHRHRYEFNTKFREQFEADGYGILGGIALQQRISYLGVLRLPSNDYLVTRLRIP